MPNVPIARITIDHMHQEMRMALTSYTGQLEEDLKKALDDAVASFDVQAMLKEEAQKILRWEVEKRMKLAIETALFKAFEDPQIKGEIESQVTNALRRILTKTWAE